MLLWRSTGQLDVQQDMQMNVIQPPETAIVNSLNQCATGYRMLKQRQPTQHVLRESIVPPLQNYSSSLSSSTTTFLRFRAFDGNAAPRVFWANAATEAVPGFAVRVLTSGRSCS